MDTQGKVLKDSIELFSMHHVSKVVFTKEKRVGYRTCSFSRDSECFPRQQHYLHRLTDMFHNVSNISFELFGFQYISQKVDFTYRSEISTNFDDIN